MGSTQRDQPSRPLLLAAMTLGVGNAIGVPWAVFRYGPGAGIDGEIAQAMGMIGVAGGTLLAVLAGGYTVLWSGRGGRAAEEVLDSAPDDVADDAPEAAPPVPATAPAEEPTLLATAAEPDTAAVRAAKAVVDGVKAVPGALRSAFGKLRAPKAA